MPLHVSFPRVGAYEGRVKSLMLFCLFVFSNYRERILRLEHENKKLKEQMQGEQEEQVQHSTIGVCLLHVVISSIYVFAALCN